MITKISQLAHRLASERHIAIRSSTGIRYITLSRSALITGLCLVLVGTAVLAQLTIGYIASSRKAAHRAAAVASAEMSNDELRDLVARLQDRLDAAGRDGGRMHAQLAALLSQNGAMHNELYGIVTQRTATQMQMKATSDLLAVRTSEIARLSAATEQAKADLRLEKKQRTGLMARIRDLEHDLQTASDEAARYRAAAETVERKLRKVSQSAVRARRAERQAAAADTAEPAPQQVASAAEGDGGIGYLADKTRRGWHELLHMLSSAGVDLDQLAARYGSAQRGEGGPFVALRSVKGAVTQQISPDELRKLAKVLPLTAPVAHYQITSDFGARSDPFKHREAFHSGVDLAVPYKTPVYNTAPGTVIFAGADGAYGKMVEIDHGSGIVTVYAHLHRILVARGQHLRHRVEIGQVGSTGRSTGPHVHYEVRLNGTPVDPEKFLDAGKTIIPVSAKEAAR